MKAYKLFRIKDGELYPLYVFANEALPMGEWLNAKAGEQNAQGKVKSKIGALAYRAGFHACEYPVATHIGGKSKAGLKKPDYRKNDQVWAEVEFETMVDYQKEADNHPKKCIVDKVPLHGVYYFQTNPNAVCRWVIGGTMKINRILSDNEVVSINSMVGLADLPRL